MRNKEYRNEDQSNEHRSNRLGFDDVMSLYVIILLIMVMIAMISMWQSKRIDLLREDLEALKKKPEATLSEIRSR